MKKAKSECPGGEQGSHQVSERSVPGHGLYCSPRRHTLSRRRIIPLPQWKANPETDPEALFQKEQLVLALYPQTTCFYRALIHTPPQRPQDDYSVLFEDTSYADGYSPPLNVAQRYVVACKEPKKK